MAEGDNPSITGAASRLGQSIISALPPGFLLLVLLNIAFLGMVMYFIDDQLDQRTRLVGRLLDHCMTTTTHQ